MPEFTDMFIDESNLDAFRDYFFDKMWQFDMTARPQMSGRDTLRNIIGDAPQIDGTRQKYLAHIVAHSDNPRDNAKTLIEMAEKYPVLFFIAYKESGNSVGGFLFNAINDQMKKNTFDKNIPAIYTLLRHGQSVFDTGRPAPEPLSAKNVKYINEIFDMSTHYNSPAQYPAARFLRDVALSDLINMDGATNALREFINTQITNAPSQEVVKHLEKLDEKFFTPKLVADVIKKRILENQKTPTPTNIQEQKNANILPAYYKKTRDALVQFARNEEIHDRENHGAQKSLSQRYREMIIRITGAKNYDVIARDSKLVRDAAIIAAQMDIMDGNAKLLDDETLRTVLAADKNNTYLRKIPTDVIEARPAVMDALNRDQRKILMAHTPKSLGNMPTDYILNSSVLSHDEKSNFVETITTQANKNIATRDALESELAEYDAEWARVEQAGQNTQTRERVAQTIDRIQKAFRNITANLKNGTPNRNEAHLAPNMIEAQISAFIFDGDRTGIEKIEEYSLPLFGRGTERARRDNLNAAIDEFNRILRQMISKTDPNAFKKHNNKMLDPDSLGYALADIKIARINADKRRQTFFATHRPRNQIENEIKTLTEQHNKAMDAKQALAQRAHNMKKLAAARMGKTTDKLAPVTSDMTDDIKRATRAANKTKSRDALSDKAKNKKLPPRRVAEMLKDMDR